MPRALLWQKAWRISTQGQTTKQTALTENGDVVSGRGDAINMHDILTGSDPQGLYSTAGGDTTCGNWTKSSDGSAIVGHHDRTGLKDTRHMNSWNSSHGSRDCSQDGLKGTGGAGLFLLFLGQLNAPRADLFFAGSVRWGECTTSDLHRSLKLEHEIVDLLGRLVTGIVMRVGWVAPEIPFGDKMEAGRFDFLSQRAFLDSMQGFAD